MPYTIYILYSPNHDRYYIGQTNNIINRLAYHNGGFEFSTFPYRPWELRCTIEKESRSEAMILEKKLKNVNRAKLLRFITKYS